MKCLSIIVSMPFTECKHADSRSVNGPRFVAPLVTISSTPPPFWSRLSSGIDYRGSALQSEIRQREGQFGEGLPCCHFLHWAGSNSSSERRGGPPGARRRRRVSLKIAPNRFFDGLQKRAQSRPTVPRVVNPEF